MTGPGGGPQEVGVAVVDLSTRHVRRRRRSSPRCSIGNVPARGSTSSVALLDVQVAMLANMGTNYLHSGEPPRRLGQRPSQRDPYQHLPNLRRLDHRRDRQ
jgi:formyl-CoA transferase